MSFIVGVGNGGLLFVPLVLKKGLLDFRDGPERQRIISPPMVGNDRHYTGSEINIV